MTMKPEVGVKAWDLSESDLMEDAPLREMTDAIMAQATASLAHGIPVTFTCGGKKLYTLYPSGRTERHDWPHG
jgi:hypothetical protein